MGLENSKMDDSQINLCLEQILETGSSYCSWAKCTMGCIASCHSLYLYYFSDYLLTFGCCTKCSLLLVCCFMITILSSLVWLVDCLLVAAFALLHAARAYLPMQNKKSVSPHDTMRMPNADRWQERDQNPTNPTNCGSGTLQDDLCPPREFSFWAVLFVRCQ